MTSREISILKPKTFDRLSQSEQLFYLTQMHSRILEATPKNKQLNNALETISLKIPAKLFGILFPIATSASLITCAFLFKDKESMVNMAFSAVELITAVLIPLISMSVVENAISGKSSLISRIFSKTFFRKEIAKLQKETDLTNALIGEDYSQATKNHDELIVEFNKIKDHFLTLANTKNVHGELVFEDGKFSMKDMTALSAKSIKELST